jgi:nucleoside-diphosphate-sugar epimerase
VNVDGTARLLHACGANGVRRIVFTSSVAVYNAAPWAFQWPIHETHPLRTTGEANLRNYALSKIEAEDLIRRAHQELGIETVVLRAAAVYGAGAAWVERTLRAIAANPWSAFSRSGAFPCNHWIHRDDLARAVVIGGTAAELRHELCNVAGPELFSARDLLVTMSRIRRQEPWMRLPVRQPDRTVPYAYRYDTTRARARLGFAPRVDLEAGLGDVLQAMAPPPAFARMPRRIESSPLAEVELF